MDGIDGDLVPTLFAGELAVDDRGSVAFVNDASLYGFRRFYVVRNHSRKFVRAWHGHRRERKLITVMSGTALICCVAVDDWDNPSPSLEVHRYVLSAERPAVLSVPGGFANGSMNLTDETAVCYFSDTSIEEASMDDVRFPARMWDPWSVIER